MLVASENLTFGFLGETLLENVNFTLSEGDRVGLIGGNGEGKTTLLRLILGELDAESGKIFRKNGAKIGYLAQNGGYDSQSTVYEEMCSIFETDRRMLDALRDVERKISQTDENSSEYKMLSAKYETLNKQISARDSYNFEIRVKTVLGGMGFADCYEQKISTMSGGEKTRLKLCRLLLEEPELLILDEPTNHLDMKTLFWLEDYLSAFKGAILVVSHDRYFLDKIVKEIYELENKKLSTFKGNYSKYKILKAEKVTHILKEYEKQQEEIARMEDYVARNLVRASTTKSAQSRRNKLEKMERIEKPALPPTPPRFCFSYAERPYERVLSVENLTLTVGDRTLLKGVDFTILRGEKCAVVGDNGTGKSTLLKEILRGKNDKIKLGRFVKISCYDQENANLDPENEVLYELWSRHSLWEQTKVRKILAQAGLGAEDMEKKVKSLSGGERAKLALAVFECENGNFLLLDEPTNHLDLQARESLEQALKEFDGTVLFVSHDRYFIQALAGKVLELSDGTATEYTGSYEEYTAFKTEEKQKKLLQKETEQRETRAPAPSVTQSYRSKQDRVAETKKRIRIKEIETKISQLESEEEEINEALSTPEVSGNYALLTEKCTRLEQIKSELDALYAEYETLI